MPLNYRIGIYCLLLHHLFFLERLKNQSNSDLKPYLGDQMPILMPPPLPCCCLQYGIQGNPIDLQWKVQGLNNLLSRTVIFDRVRLVHVPVNPLK